MPSHHLDITTECKIFPAKLLKILTLENCNFRLGHQSLGRNSGVIRPLKKNRKGDKFHEKEISKKRP